MLPRIETKLAESGTLADLSNSASYQGDLRQDLHTASEHPHVRIEAKSKPMEPEIVDWVRQDQGDSRMPISTADLFDLVTSGSIPKFTQLHKGYRCCGDRSSESGQPRA